MARARTLKPGFFKNEDLVELPFEYRLLFAGLWTLADREGRLEDRPKRIKMEVFPADDVDIDHGLTELARYGLLERYAAEGVRVVAIPRFRDHQNPHPKEKASGLPGKPELTGPSGADHDQGTAPHDATLAATIQVKPDDDSLPHGHGKKHPGQQQAVTLQSVESHGPAADPTVERLVVAVERLLSNMERFDIKATNYVDKCGDLGGFQPIIPTGSDNTVGRYGLVTERTLLAVKRYDPAVESSLPTGLFPFNPITSNPINLFPFQTLTGLKGGVGENFGKSEPGGLPLPHAPSAAQPDAAPHSGLLPLTGSASAEEDAIPDVREPSLPPAAPVAADKGSAGTLVAGALQMEPVGALTTDLLSDAQKGVPAPPARAKKAKTRESCTLKTALEEFHRNAPEDQHFIQEDDPIHEWGEKIGLPNHFLFLTWVEFERRFIETKKRQKDWRAHFRNACRGNWFRLWFAADDGSYQLTTAGIQLDRELAADHAREQEGRECHPDFHGEGEMLYDALSQKAHEDDNEDHSAALIARLFGDGGNPFSPEKWLN